MVGRSPTTPTRRSNACEPVPVAHNIDPGSIHIAPLTREHAEDIANWQYPAPYGTYDMVGADPAELLLPEVGYHAVLTGDRLIGFRSFGPDGQVPGWAYDDSALDTGGGLRRTHRAGARKHCHFHGTGLRTRTVRTDGISRHRGVVQRSCPANS